LKFRIFNIIYKVYIPLPVGNTGAFWHWQCCHSTQLCCHGKVLDFMIKKHEIHKKASDYKIKLTRSENAQKMHWNTNHRHSLWFSATQTIDKENRRY